MGLLGQFGGNSLPLFLEMGEPHLDELVAGQDEVHGGQEGGREAGFADVDQRFQALGGRFELADLLFGKRFGHEAGSLNTSARGASSVLII